MKRFFGMAVSIAALCLAGPSTGKAQGTQHLPLDKAVTSGDWAKRTLTKTQISGDIAQAIVNACVDLAKKSNGTLTVFVLDPDGEIAASHRMDGQNTINTVTGYKKAQTALMLRISTHQPPISSIRSMPSSSAPVWTCISFPAACPSLWMT